MATIPCCRHAKLALLLAVELSVSLAAEWVSIGTDSNFGPSRVELDTSSTETTTGTRTI